MIFDNDVIDENIKVAELPLPAQIGSKEFSRSGDSDALLSKRCRVFSPDSIVHEQCQFVLYTESPDREVLLTELY